MFVLLYFVEYSWRLELWFWPKPYGFYKGNGPVGAAFFREEFLSGPLIRPRLIWVPTTLLALVGTIIALDSWNRVPKTWMVLLSWPMFLAGVVLPWMVSWLQDDRPRDHEYEKCLFWSFCALVVTILPKMAAQSAVLLRGRSPSAPVSNEV
ncbi:MAG: hypothetical protein Q8K78_16760 [Planctomycetaceae bacterium]|nr:hypothetical protein [Planctomycetaceae bacterium]